MYCTKAKVALIFMLIEDIMSFQLISMINQCELSADILKFARKFLCVIISDGITCEGHWLSFSCLLQAYWFIFDIVHDIEFIEWMSRMSCTISIINRMFAAEGLYASPTCCCFTLSLWLRYKFFVVLCDPFTHILEIFSGLYFQVIYKHKSARWARKKNTSFPWKTSTLLDQDWYPVVTLFELLCWRGYRSIMALTKNSNWISNWRCFKSQVLLGNNSFLLFHYGYGYCMHNNND